MKCSSWCLAFRVSTHQCTYLSTTPFADFRSSHLLPSMALVAGAEDWVVPQSIGQGNGNGREDLRSLIIWERLCLKASWTCFNKNICHLDQWWWSQNSMFYSWRHVTIKPAVLNSHQSWTTRCGPKSAVPHFQFWKSFGGASMDGLWCRKPWLFSHHFELCPGFSSTCSHPIWGDLYRCMDMCNCRQTHRQSYRIPSNFTRLWAMTCPSRMSRLRGFQSVLGNNCSPLKSIQPGMLINPL